MIALVLVAAIAQAPEATSLLGKPLIPVAPAGAAKERLEANLAKAQSDYDADPRDADKIIWLGRRLAYLTRYREAIEVYTRGIALHPNDARLYRHRGHRYLSTRQLAKAVKDFEKAAQLVRGTKDEIEPDGQPNKLNQPLSTLQFNIWYHLGLAHYLRGDFAKAGKAYEECMKVSRHNDDSLVATTDWLYMTLRRLGRPGDAARVLEPIHERMTIIENGSYHERLLLYKGLRKPEQVLNASDDLALATQGYGVGNWYLYNGDRAKAREIFLKVVAGKQWSAFGYIAAESELARK